MILEFLRRKFFPKDSELSEDSLIKKAQKNLHSIRSVEYLAHSRKGYELGVKENIECSIWLKKVIAFEPGTRKPHLIEVLQEIKRLKGLCFRT